MLTNTITLFLIIKSYKLPFAFSFLLSLILLGQEKKKWVTPLEIPIQLSGTFGEIRNNHFHAGLDIRTQGRQGLKVKSVQSGYINRIRVSTGGYGKALYIQHFDGTTSVYAHLKKFAPKIEAYLKEKQYEKESYTLQLFPKEKELEVGLGELIGYSGNTGGSSGPHLHFEIRDSRDQSPMNPMQFPLKIDDTQRPQIQNFYLYSDKDSFQSKKEYPLIKKNDSVYTTAGIRIGGSIQVGLRLFDRQNLSYNKNGIYSASLRLNGNEEFAFSMDRISFDDSKSINLIIDYKNLKQNRNRIQRFASHPKAQFSFLDQSPADGTLYLSPNKSYQLLIELSDYNGNTSYIEAYLVGGEAPQKKTELQANLLEPIKDYLFDFGATSVYFPKDSFFQKAAVHVEQKGDTLMVGQDLVPLKKPFDINFNVSEMDSLQKTQSFISKIVKNRKPAFLNTKKERDQWSTKSKTLGEFILSRDSLAPKIVPLNFKEKQWLSNYSFLKFKITDDYTGIKSYRGEINGKWILLEYEPKNNTLIFDFDELKFETALHELILEAEDFVGNKTIFSIDFYRK
ncbi:MAG: M23 family metallopeptidase [Flavobacteriaceae bacterium]|nr:M23 family metallopeptidase [Flavobacteriaceae bacterium]